MSDFITGTLERNEAGATYEGVTYDRWLSLRVGNNHLLRIFDMAAITADLRVGSKYRVLVTELEPSNMEVFPRKPACFVSSHQWYGTVTSTYWRPPEMQYQCATDNYRNHKGVLVNTQHGWILLDHDNFKQPPSAGNFIQWNQTRLDLLAVF